MPGCSARFCKNRSDQGFLMHVFPRDPKRRAIWAEQVKRDNWEPSNYCYLCEAHFEESQFELRRMDGKVKLKPCAVPTIFHHTAEKPGRKPRFSNEPRTAEEGKGAATGGDSWSLLQSGVCNAKNCTSFSHGEPVALFPFPSDEDRCREWVRRSQNEALTDLPADVLHADARLCSRHFEDDQFVDPARENLAGDALPSVFPRHFVSVPMAEEASQSCRPLQDFEHVKTEPAWGEGPPLTYRRLCADACRVPLPSPAWAVHRGPADGSIAFVRASPSETLMHVDAVVFRDTCRAHVYLRGRRVLLGMGQVKTLTEIEALLTRLDTMAVPAT